MPQNNDAATDYWDNDSIQFPRLIAEIGATQELDMAKLCESMDLDPEQLAELFYRAQFSWECIKEATAMMSK